MKKAIQLTSTKLTPNEEVSWNSQPIHRLYPRLRVYISSKLGEQFGDFFAEPKLQIIGGNKNISWITEDKGLKFNDLSQAAATNKSWDQIDLVRNLIVQLQASLNDDDKTWAAILKACLSAISLEDIYFDGDRVVVAMWGVKKKVAKPVFDFGNSGNTASGENGRKKFLILKTSKFEDNEAILWNNQPIYRLYPRLQLLLTTELGAPFEFFLAEPKQEATEGAVKKLLWGTEDSPSTFRTYKEIAEIQNAEDTIKVEKTLNKIKAFIEQLSGSAKDEERTWAGILKTCLANISPEDIFFDGNRVVVTQWGLKAITSTPIWPFEIDVPANGSYPPKDFPTDLVDEDADPENTQPKEADELQPDANKLRESEPELPPNMIEEQPIIKPPLVTDNNLVDEGTNELPTNDNNRNNDKKTDDNTSSNNVPPPPPPTKTTSFGEKFKNNWWWWLLILLMLAFLLRWATCYNIPQNPLPQNPNVPIPVDSSEITFDEDSIRLIAGDRLNIVLKGKNKNVQAFAASFKKEYPGKEYSIIYYDTATSLLQIKIPESERVKLAKELPQKLTQYEMLIWHESIFSRDAFPSDPDFKDRSKSWFLAAIQADKAWDYSFGSDSVTVVVADDGFDLAHPEFNGRYQKPRNAFDKSSNVYTYKRSIHGTHVAGIAVANKDNNTGVAGVAPNCKLVPVQVASSSGIISGTAVIDAILYAISIKADVINLSLGMKFNPIVATFPVNVQLDLIANSLKEEELFWNELFEMAEENNLVVVIAAGNDNVLAGLDPMQRSATTIKVAAVNQSLKKSSFSNYGIYSTISAPGSQIYSSFPNKNFDYLDGTSMAAPLVAGAVALVKSVKPNFTPAEIRNLLVSTALPISSDIGPMLQLGNAMAQIDQLPNTPPNDLCNTVQEKIDSLLAEVERLRNTCPNVTPIDTMKMPEVIDNLDFCIGKWKSTSYLHNEKGEKITLFFEFNAAQEGVLTLSEPNGYNCEADLSLKAANNEFIANQLNAAMCSISNKSYTQYIFTCAADNNGYAQCVAQNKLIKANRVQFKLVKVQ